MIIKEILVLNIYNSKNKQNILKIVVKIFGEYIK